MVEVVAKLSVVTIGNLYHISNMGAVLETFTVEGTIHSLLYSLARQSLVVVTQTMQLYQYAVDPNSNSVTLSMNVSCSYCMVEIFGGVLICNY